MTTISMTDTACDRCNADLTADPPACARSGGERDDYGLARHHVNSRFSYALTVQYAGDRKIGTQLLL